MKALATALVLLTCLLATEVRGAGQTVDGWSVSRSGASIVVVLSGSWPNGCTPDVAQVSISSGLVSILVPPTTGICTAGFTRWSLTVPIEGIGDGSYTVRVTSYGYPEPPTSPATLIQFGLFVNQGVASLAQTIPVGEWPALVLISCLLLSLAWRQLRARPNLKFERTRQ